MPIRLAYTPKRGKTNKNRPLGKPAIGDRVCQQALKNRLEPIFELGFNDCNFRYRLRTFTPSGDAEDLSRIAYKDTNG